MFHSPSFQLLANAVGMEERKEESGAEIQEHGPEHWFSKWERQCLAEAEQSDPNEEETEQSQQKLWHLFQNSATAVAQLYKGLYHDIGWGS